MYIQNFKIYALHFEEMLSLLLITLDLAIRAYSQVFEFTEATFPYIRDQDVMIINFFMPGSGSNFWLVL